MRKLVARGDAALSLGKRPGRGRIVRLQRRKTVPGHSAWKRERPARSGALVALRDGRAQQDVVGGAGFEPATLAV